MLKKMYITKIIGFKWSRKYRIPPSVIIYNYQWHGLKGGPGLSFLIGRFFHFPSFQKSPPLPHSHPRASSPRSHLSLHSSPPRAPKERGPTFLLHRPPPPEPFSIYIYTQRRNFEAAWFSFYPLTNHRSGEVFPVHFTRWRFPEAVPFSFRKVVVVVVLLLMAELTQPEVYSPRTLQVWKTLLNWLAFFFQIFVQILRALGHLRLLSSSSSSTDSSSPSFKPLPVVELPDHDFLAASAVDIASVEDDEESDGRVEKLTVFSFSLVDFAWWMWGFPQNFSTVLATEEWFLLISFA